jgi:transcriptional regulator with XRE-family HTH domain
VFQKGLHKLVQTGTIGHMTEQPAGRIPVFTMGDRLRKAREVVGLDQSEFAEQLGVSRGTVSNYERSSTENRKPIVIRAWALATGVPLEWLQTGEGAPTATPPDGGPAGQTPEERLDRLASRKRPTGGAPGGNHR